MLRMTSLFLSLTIIASFWFFTSPKAEASSASEPAAIVAAVTASPVTVAAAQGSDLTEDERRRREMIAQGKYLVHRGSLCVQCHSPRGRDGELREDRLLTGGAIPMTSPYPGPRWAFHAPNIRRATGYTEAEFITFLSTGIRPDGTEARGPMPPFRMNTRDARAIYMYLRTQ